MGFIGIIFFDFTKLRNQEMIEQNDSITRKIEERINMKKTLFFEESAFLLEDLSHTFWLFHLFLD